ncbi:MAG: 50S ribosomal protein L6, partial [Oceanospirillaceae bacterium]|nr:50S ribosomal protein L6 [Oceanospirillaceae bacterium]
MSRVANSPVTLPSGVDLTLNGQTVVVKGGKGSLEFNIHTSVQVSKEENVITFAARDGAKQSRALAGTTRALVNNMVTGVSQGFEKKLQLVGVGYRTKVSGKTL